MSRDRYAPALALYHETSRQAFASVLAALPSVDARIVSVIERRSGATCAEIEEATELKHQTVSAQVRHMVEAGLLVDSGTTRKNANGRGCIVWALAPRYSGPMPSQPGYLSSLPVVASIERHKGPVSVAAPPTEGRLFACAA